MADNPTEYMKEVLKLAEDALQQGELPIAAMIVLDGNIISSAVTSEKLEKRFLVHAELLALEKADKLSPFPGKRMDAKLFTNLEPCMMCLGAVMSSFIGSVYYSLESPSDGAVEVAKQWERSHEDFPGYKLPMIEGGILRKESKELFKKYTKLHSSGPMFEWAKSLAALPL